MASDQPEAAFAYHEPAIAIVLNLAGFLLVLNIVNVCLDKLLYCGLIGQLFIGILWGTPGAKWLDRGMETAVQQLGYLGLIMLVYEGMWFAYATVEDFTHAYLLLGGLSTSIKSLKANLLLSLSVALTGIAVPMGLSFILMELVSATPLQAFAAGAALSATSLGTTFTILSTTNLITTRLGVVTTSAAMIDDVVGLIMVQIISNLGGSEASFSAVTVIRPIFVSIGFAVGLFLACRLCLQPVLRKLVGLKDRMPEVMSTAQFAFVTHTCVLVGLVAGATYAGTSSLFAAYIAGVIVSWFDGIVADSKEQAEPPQQSVVNKSSNTQDTSDNGRQPNRERTSSSSPAEHPPTAGRDEIPTGVVVYERYYKEPVNRVFIPLFFASIGFAIPITEMFQGSVIWRGIVYALLMAIGKLVTGLWLVRVSLSPVSSLMRTATKPFSYARLVCFNAQKKSAPRQKQPPGSEIPMKTRTSQPEVSEETSDSAFPSTNPTSRADRSPQPEPSASDHPAPSATNRISLPPKPKSLYPPSILGLAMVARGEIGYLIASLAEAQGIFSDGTSTGTTESYLVIVWAITLCTLIGPICVGTLVRRVKTLQQNRVNAGGMDPLGVWGI
ncbi:Sodium/hydrogen exchanger [Aspergillus affinis]|uniref:Sodium/hydrogen exchanger n=1 Tax=Aspergillus affinis TaxID=1070780 RepID=UPI0022FE15FA|nr:Sodium/hydrogen exchanger [Aspergillus affinis]KAI9044711.1 Sodium/hydrogen exchanger [Aspergillus affinis]